MPRPDLRIPGSQKAAIRIILNGDESQLDAILSALRELPPSMYLPASAEFVADRAQINEKDAAVLLAMIASLFQLQDQPGFVVDDLQSEVLKAARADDELDISDDQFSRLARFLTESLALGDSLGVTSKAWSVARDSEHTYCYSRILTDLRPVFKPRSDEPAAFVLVHNLKLAYHKGEQLREFFLALTQQDIDALVKVLERAHKKGKNLEKAVKPTELPTLESE